jgi:hypothetical protein
MLVDKCLNYWALIKKRSFPAFTRGFPAFTRGFAAAQRTRIPRLHTVFVFNFLWVNFRHSYTSGFQSWLHRFIKIKT